MKELQVEIVSPEGYLFNGHCHLVTVPSVDGEMGLMVDHEAVLAHLDQGSIIIYDAQQNILKEFPVKNGFAEMFDNKLLVLVG